MNIPNTPYNEVYETRHGKFCIQSADKFMGKGLRELGECGEDETQLLCSLVERGDTVIDCGANVGLRTIPLSKKVTNSGRVFAFEPERINFLNLCANIALNSCYSVYPFQMAVGKCDGETSIPHVDPWNCDNMGLIDLKKCAEEKRPGMVVPIIPLDAFNLNPKLIKIDVEGMESEVLAGARQTIHQWRPYLFCECFDQPAAEKLAAVIVDFAYDGYIFESNLFSENNWRGVKVNEFECVSSPNILFVPYGKLKPESDKLRHCVTTGIPT
jgi:FkbM family methyltransferase